MIIDPGTFKSQFSDILSILGEQAREAWNSLLSETAPEWDKFKADARSAWEDFENCIKEKPNVNLLTENVEFLKSENLVEFAKKYIAPDSNEVFAWKMRNANAFYIHLAYGRNGELLENSKNHFVVIKAEGLSADVVNLFSNSDLVILK